MTVTTGAGRIDVVAGAEYAQLGEATLSEVARRVLAVDDLHRATAVLQPVSYDIGTVSTCALLRAVGRATVGGRTARWSAFVKVLQSPLAWELLHVIPDHLRDRFVREFPWRLEIDALRSPVRSVLPDCLRMPELYAVHEPDDLHAALWMEDVDERTGPWSLDTFARAARLLGELAGRRPVGSEAAFGDPLVRLQPGFGLRMYAESRVKHESAQVFASDATWADPVLVAALDD
ncbi:MAG TPA: hypothetical protein VH419_17770, partial [Nocardioidaceae bacterium]